MKRALEIVIFFSIFSLAFLPGIVSGQTSPCSDIEPPFISAGPKPNILIILDNSGSMQGLIDQARSQLWTVVNHLARTKKDGQTPRLEVAPPDARRSPSRTTRATAWPRRGKPSSTARGPSRSTSP